MNNETRPFEVGDLVTGHTIYRPDIKITATIAKVFNKEITVKIDDSDFILLNNEFIVKHIRKPRKGSKEARDIVAMLAYSYWKSLKGLSKGWLFGVEKEKHKEAMKNWWNRRKRKDEFILRSSVYFEYQKAKSMLK